MSAADLLRRCRRAGVRLWLVGDEVRFSGPPAGVDAALRHDLTAHRASVVDGLRRIGAAQTVPVTEWSEDDRERYEERAAIREFDAGQARVAAERAAEDEVRRAMLREAGA